MISILKVYWDSNLPIHEISQSELQKKGINSLLLDVDGTLVNRKSNMVSKSVKNWIRESKKYFSLYLISNNPSKKKNRKNSERIKFKIQIQCIKTKKKSDFVCYQRNRK